MHTSISVRRHSAVCRPLQQSAWGPIDFVVYGFTTLLDNSAECQWWQGDSLMIALQFANPRYFSLEDNWSLWSVSQTTSSVYRNADVEQNHKTFHVPSIKTMLYPIEDGVVMFNVWSATKTREFCGSIALHLAASAKSGQAMASAGRPAHAKNFLDFMEKQVWQFEVSWTRGTYPKIIHFNGKIHYKPSI